MTRMFVKGVLLVLVAVAFAGCASAARGDGPQATPKKVANRGEVYLTMSGNNLTGWPPPGKSRHRGKYIAAPPPGHGVAMPRRISLVKMENDRGRVVRNHPVPISSGEVVIETLQRELARAGFRVKVVRRLPKQAELGVDVTTVSADLRQRSRLLGLTGSCDLRVGLELWQGGVKRHSHQYASVASGSSADDRDLLVRILMSRAAQDVTEQALVHIGRI